MSGYAALERVDGGRVRAIAWSGPGRSDDLPFPVPHVTRDRARVDDRPLADRVRERWAILREEWAIMTFFLMDPESWR
jgi:hypothetical protein